MSMPACAAQTVEIGFILQWSGNASRILITLCVTSAPSCSTSNTHGTGCTLASAIAAELAKGASPMEAVRLAKAFVTDLLRASANLAIGSGKQRPMNHGCAPNDADAAFSYSTEILRPCRHSSTTSESHTLLVHVIALSPLAHEHARLRHNIFSIPGCGESRESARFRLGTGSPLGRAQDQRTRRRRPLTICKHDRRWICGRTSSPTLAATQGRLCTARLLQRHAFGSRKFCSTAVDAFTSCSGLTAVHACAIKQPHEPVHFQLLRIRKVIRAVYSYHLGIERRVA